MTLPNTRAGRGYAWLAAICTILALYGSFIPFEYSPRSWADALAIWKSLHFVPLDIPSRTDFAANILLFLVVAFFIMAALTADRQRSAVRVGLLLVPALALLSAAIEFVQIWFPPRTPATSDIVGETVGAFLGVCIWLAAGRSFTLWVRRVFAAPPGVELAKSWFKAYVLFLIFINLMPFDLSLDLAGKYRDGRILLIPFEGLRGDLFGTAQKTLWSMFCFFPAGVLLAVLPATCWRKWSHGLRAVGWGLLLALAIEVLQTFIATRFVNATDLTVETVGVATGWLSLRWWHTTRSSAPGRFLREPRTLLYVFALWLMVVSILTWRPFEFDFNGSAIKARLGEISLLPFADYWQGSEYHAFDQFVRKLLLYLPLGALICMWTPTARRCRAALVASIWSFALASAFEVIQVFIPVRHASLTDILVETAGGWLGFILVRNWQEKSAR